MSAKAMKTSRMSWAERVDTEEETERLEEWCDPVAEGDDQEDVDIEAEEEHAAQVPLRDPGQPTQAQWDTHMLTHIPFRPWCPHCIRGKARGRQSRRIGEAESQSAKPRVRLDYCVITD